MPASMPVHGCCVSKMWMSREPCPVLLKGYCVRLRRLVSSGTALAGLAGAVGAAWPGGEGRGAQGEGGEATGVEVGGFGHSSSWGWVRTGNSAEVTGGYLTRRASK